MILDFSKCKSEKDVEAVFKKNKKQIAIIKNVIEKMKVPKEEGK